MIAALNMTFFSDELRVKLLDFARPRGIVAVSEIYLPFRVAHKLRAALHARMMFITANTTITKERWNSTGKAWKFAGFTGPEIETFDHILFKEYFLWVDSQPINKNITKREHTKEYSYGNRKL